MSRVPKIPVEAMDPRYRELLLRGSIEAFSLDCKTKAKASQLRFILHSMRNRLRKTYEGQDDHKDKWVPLYGTIISIPKETPHILVFKPRAAEFEDILDAAALAETTPSSPAKPKTILTHDPLEDLEGESE